MKLKYLYAYENLGHYLEHMQENDAWEQIMIAPFWSQIAEWTPFPVDFMKPAPILDKQIVMNQMNEFKKFQISDLAPKFEMIVERLPKADEDPMTIAIYPSDNDMVEGIYGTGVWGNIIMNVNPTNKNSVHWMPFVFAHEYHHNVLGFHWYCIKEGKETKGNFLEAIINEGQADIFAQSIFPSLYPSWHQGISADCEQIAWERIKDVLYKIALVEEFAPYMFGSKELEIPSNAGYYFGHAIVNDYIKKYPHISFTELLQTPHQVIFNESKFSW